MLGVVVVGLSIFAFGGMLLILLFGGSQIEPGLEGEQGDDRERRPLRAAGPLLGDLQSYLAAEQEAADEFVSRPSLDTLYRDAGQRLGSP